MLGALSGFVLVSGPLRPRTPDERKGASSIQSKITEERARILARAQEASRTTAPSNEAGPEPRGDPNLNAAPQTDSTSSEPDAALALRPENRGSDHGSDHGSAQTVDSSNSPGEEHEDLSQGAVPDEGYASEADPGADVQAGDGALAAAEKNPVSTPLPEAAPAVSSGQEPLAANQGALELEGLRRAKNPKSFVKAFQIVLALNQPLVNEQALVICREKLQSSITELRDKGKSSLSKLEKARAMVDAAREAALVAIRDEKAYRKEGGKRVFGQELVDETVEALRAIHRQASGVKVGKNSSLRSAAAWITALDGILTQNDAAQYKGLEFKDQQLAALAGQGLSFDSYAKDRDEVYRRWRDAQVLAWNAKVAIGEEGRCLAVLNEYRATLGLHALACDLRAVESARGHSNDMLKGGFFAHDSPIPGKRSPADRMGKAGLFESPTNAQSFFEKGPLPSIIASERISVRNGTGENIAMGVETGAAAFQLWYRSPPHHRNMIGNWDVLGVGKAGNHWTQNFAGLNVSTTRR